MQSDRISDERITASSWLSSEHMPFYGRMGRNIGHGAWCAAVNDTNQFLEIDLGIEHMVTKIITEGKHRLSKDHLGEAWVKEFFISYSTGLEHWSYVKDVNTQQPIVSIKNSFWLSLVSLNVKCLHPQIVICQMKDGRWWSFFSPLICHSPPFSHIVVSKPAKLKGQEIPALRFR